MAKQAENLLTTSVPKTPRQLENRHALHELANWVPPADLTALSVFSATFDALSDALLGIVNRPCAEPIEETLDNWQMGFYALSTAVVEQARTLTPRDETELESKANILIKHDLAFGLAAPEFSATLATLSADAMKVARTADARPLAVLERAVSRTRSTPVDQAFELGTQIKALQERFNFLDEAIVRKTPPAGVHEENYRDESEHVSDRIYDLRDALSAVQATTLAGAAAQVWEVFNLFDILRTSAMDDQQREEAYRKVRRMLFSVSRVISDQLTSGERASLEALPERCDPWTKHEDPMASPQNQGQ